MKNKEINFSDKFILKDNIRNAEEKDKFRFFNYSMSTLIFSFFSRIIYSFLWIQFNAELWSRNVCVVHILSIFSTVLFNTVYSSRKKIQSVQKEVDAYNLCNRVLYSNYCYVYFSLLYY